MPRGIAIVLVAAAAVLVAGCGGRSTPTADEFGQSVVSARDRVDFALARITRAQSKDDLLERMDEAADAIDDTVRDLEDVGALRRLDAELGALIDSLRQLAFDVQATADQVRQPGFSDFLAGTKGLSFESWDAVNRALEALNAQGIEVAPLERH
jgi:methyl-accepting chemotaxis protein